METVIYHGSEKIVEVPTYGYGKNNNDFGRGFYCTQEIELAKEWGCKKGTDGFANCYTIDMSKLHIINLNSPEYNILHWLALLTKYRGYWQVKSIAEQAKIYLQEHYLVDISVADIIIGNRADDSYFSFAQDFIMGTISLQKLAVAMQLGRLGEQLVLKSKRAFGSVKFVGQESAYASEYYIKKTQRDLRARREYASVKSKTDYMNDIYMIDILRGRVQDDALRI